MKNQGSSITKTDSTTSSPLNLGQIESPRGDVPRARAGATTDTPSPRKGSAEQPRDFDHREVARKLKQDYAHGAREAGIRHLDALHSLIKYLMKADPNLDDMLQQTARSIYTQFNIKEVSIALRSTSDGLYRYVAEHGMRADVWAAHDKIVYTYDDLIDTRKYKPVTISHQTQLFLAEDNPYGPDERDTFSEHMMKQSKRKAATDSIEGDYLDIFLYGPQDEILGWIELSGTWDSKIPEARTIRCLELVSSVLAIAVTKHRMVVEIQRPSETPGPAKRIEQAKK